MDPRAAMRSVRYGVAAECSPAAPVLRETAAAGPSKPKLLDRVRHAVRARHYSPRTEKACVHWIKRYIFFHGKRHPGEIGAAEVTAFLTAPAVRERVAASTQNQALNALLFLYRQILGVELPWLDDLVRAKRPQHLPSSSRATKSARSSSVWTAYPALWRSCSTERAFDSWNAASRESRTSTSRRTRSRSATARAARTG